MGVTVAPRLGRRGLLSIVVPTYNVAPYLRASLGSILRQTYRNIEVIVIDDGSTDGSGRIARAIARRDPRVRVVRQGNRGLGAARNAGARLARGEFITFIDSDDTVSRHSFRPVIDALRESGSDMAVSPYRRLVRNLEHPAGVWIYQVHETERLGTTLSEFPEIQVNAVAWSKVYRREFWEANEIAFPEGVLYEDQAVSTKAYALAGGIDVLTEPTVNWRVRDDGSSISQSALAVRNAEDHLLAASTSLEILEEAGLDGARRVRLSQLLANDYSHMVPMLPDAADEEWAAYATAIRLFLSEAERYPGIWDEVPSRNKVAYALVDADRRADLEGFLLEGGWRNGVYPTRLDGDRVLVDYPQAKFLHELPDRTFALSDFETRVRSRVQSIRWISESELEIHGSAVITGIDPAENDVAITASLVADGSGDRLEIPIEFVPDPLGTAGLSSASVDGRKAHFRALVDIRPIPEKAERYHVELTLASGAVSRSRLLHDYRSGGDTEARLTGSGLLIDFIADRLDFLTLAVSPPPVLVDSSIVRRRLTVVVAGDVDAVALVRADDRFNMPLSVTRLRPLADGTGEATIAVPLEPPAALGGRYTQRVWRIEGRDRNGGWTSLVTPTTIPLRGATPTSNQSLAVERRVGGFLSTDRKDIGRGRLRYLPGSGALLVERVLSADVIGVELDQNALTVRLRTAGLDGDSLTAQLKSRKHSFAGAVRSVEPGIFDARFSLQASTWGMPPAPIPSDLYEITVADARASVRPILSGALSSRMPMSRLLRDARLWIHRSADGRLAVDVSAPLQGAERGAYNVARQRERADGLTVVDRPGQRSIVFRCLYGEVANDSAEAVHHELRRRGSSLRLIWSVKDHSVRIPEGGERVIEDSAQFFTAMGESKYVMVNVHQPDWFKKKPGQVLIQTFHGYPFKLAGRRHWESSMLPPARIASFEQRALEWDYLLSPAHYATPLLREFLPEDRAWPGEMLELGYPRNDVLLSPERHEIRRIARERLGIPENHTVVLYAPTYRDYLSIDEFRARPMQELDLKEIAAALGPEHTVLVRGHVMNSRVGYSVKGANLLDVTDHPSIVDLTLASNVGILDYSSLRFDYALTGNPMIFFVPDRERYFASREPMIPYEGTAPGPWLNTTAEVIAALERLPELRAEFAPEIRTFRERFMELDDGHAASRLVDAVFVPRGDA